MLNVAYCRVSTEEQAAERFSIDGQAEKLRTYAKLHDLGPVIVIEDPGRSGKDLDRPGLQQVLAMVKVMPRCMSSAEPGRSATHPTCSD